MSALTDAERDQLRVILRLAHAIERDWPRTGGNRDSRLVELQTRIARLSAAENPNLSRLAKWAEHLPEGSTLRHFQAILVPFERFAQRALRDDEILVIENDTQPDGRPISRVPLVVVLENLRSAFNVGAVFRTAECFAATEIVICGYTPGPDDAKTSKTAMGTDADVPWRRFDRVEEACLRLKKEGYAIVALETAATAVPLGEFRFPERTALILGNERFGVSQDTIRLADHVCRIPLRGRKNSLNVGIAFGIAAAEFDRQWNAR